MIHRKEKDCSSNFISRDIPSPYFSKVIAGTKFMPILLLQLQNAILLTLIDANTHQLQMLSTPIALTPSHNNWSFDPSSSTVATMCS